MGLLRYEMEVCGASGSDDDLVNDAREAVARSGFQVGECDVLERSATDATLSIEIDDSRRDPLSDPIIPWNGQSHTVVGVCGNSG